MNFSSTDPKPLAIDLFCGLGGWTEGLLAEGYRVIGFYIEAHEYGEDRYPCELVVADVLELDGAQFAEAALIVASPPCQEYSYMAMPWTRAKDKAAAIRADACVMHREKHLPPTRGEGRCRPCSNTGADAGQITMAEASITGNELDMQARSQDTERADAQTITRKVSHGDL